MKRVIFALVFTLAGSLFLPNRCSAQFQNHFNIYTTQSLDSTATIVYQTVTFDGYTQVPAQMPTNGVFHAAHVQNKMGTHGGMYTGPSVCPSCYISVSNSQSDVPGNLIEDDNTGAEVQCTSAGVFFASFFFLHYEVAYTRVVQPPGQLGSNCEDGVGIGSLCDFDVANWCTANTTPPDMSLTKLRYDWYIDAHPWGWEAYGIVFRAGTSGPWTGGTNLLQWAFPDYAPQLLAICKHNP